VSKTPATTNPVKVTPSVSDGEDVVPVSEHMSSVPDDWKEAIPNNTSTKTDPLVDKLNKPNSEFDISKHTSDEPTDNTTTGYGYKQEVDYGVNDDKTTFCKNDKPEPKLSLWDRFLRWLNS
jgi:hypothetical protein